MKQHTRLIAAGLAFAMLAGASSAQPGGAQPAPNAPPAQPPNAAPAPDANASGQPASASSAPAPTGGGSLRQACAADFQQQCPDYVWGTPGGMGACMKGHYAAFSQPCKSALVAVRNASQGAKSAPSQPLPPPVSSQ
jgi:hypothetical protein